MWCSTRVPRYIRCKGQPGISAILVYIGWCDLKGSGIPRLQHYDFSRKTGQFFFKSLWGSLEQSKGAVVHWHYHLHLFEIGAQRIACMDRVHGKVSADVQQGQIRLVVVADKRHVGKYPGVTGMVNLIAVLLFDNIPARFTARMHGLFLGPMIGVHHLGAVFGSHHCDANAISQRRDGPALVEPDQPVIGHPSQCHKGMPHVYVRGHLGIVLLGDGCRIAHMVSMVMGHQDQVHLAQLSQVFQSGRCFEIFGDKGIDLNHIAPRRGEIER